MLTVNGEECLLGRQRRFAKGMYSALAGYLEPGETIEAAVRREIREEAGIALGRVDLMSRRSPGRSRFADDRLFRRGVSQRNRHGQPEFEDARWFSREAVMQMLAGTHSDGLTAPVPIAIANTLLRTWIEGPLVHLRRPSRRSERVVRVRPEATGQSDPRQEELAARQRCPGTPELSESPD